MVQGWGLLSDSDIAEAVRLANQALETGKDNPDTLWMAGYTLAYFAGKREAGVGAIERALARNPNSAHAWSSLGWVQFFRNCPDLAVGALERAIRLSPFDPIGYTFTLGLAGAHMAAGQYEDHMKWIDRTLREQSRLVSAIRVQVVALCGDLGRVDEGHAWLERLLQCQPGLMVARLVGT